MSSAICAAIPLQENAKRRAADSRPGGVVQKTCVGRKRREEQAHPLRRRVYLGAGRTAGRRGRRPLRRRVYPGAGRTAGRRGRRPGGCETGRSVVGAAALGRPRTWMKVGETGRRRRCPLRDGTEYRTRCESAGRRGRRPRRGGAKYQARCGNGGRGKPLPYGDGCTRVRDVQRDVEDAVPYGCETVRPRRRGRRPRRPGGISR